MDELYQTFAAENEKLFRWLERPMPISWEMRGEKDLLLSSPEERAAEPYRRSGLTR
jgi:hypothetical protein